MSNKQNDEILENHRENCPDGENCKHTELEVLNDYPETGSEISAKENKNYCWWCEKELKLGEDNVVSKFNDLTKEVLLFHESCKEEADKDAYQENIQDQEQRWAEEREMDEEERENLPADEEPEEPKGETVL